jgi:hypothetical protein
MVVELVVVREREQQAIVESLYCKIFSWVRRSTLQLGAQGGRRERERERSAS